MEAITKALNRNPLVSGTRDQIVEYILEMEEKLKIYKCYVNMSYDEFKELLTVNAYKIMLQRSITRQFIIDKNNGPIIKELYLYFTNDPTCIWNLNQGLIFGGKIGCGKSLLMMAYLKISDEYTRKRTSFIHSKSLSGLIKKNGIEHYEKWSICIDELGREESETKDYGNVVKPVIDLFALRYESGARTYATTNFKYESLEKFYGEFIRSRMEEMMTYVHIPGESRRLRNEVKTR